MHVWGFFGFFFYMYMCVYACNFACACSHAKKKVAVSLGAYDFVYVRPSEDISMRGWDCAC